MRELIQFIRNHIADVKFEVKLIQSRFASLEPVVLVHAPDTTSHHETTAALFVLAGEVSLRSGEKERWCVRVEPIGDTEGRVYLELATSTETEAARGIRLLEGDRQMTRVFVYGSLLEGELNHRVMEGACFVGAATTSSGFTLLDLGDYPAMVASSQGRVMGEVYEVSRAHLARLDHFEGHPRFYTRSRIPLADGTEAETYLMPPERVEQRKPISSGDWRSYRKEQKT